MPNNNIYVINKESKDELVKRGFKLIAEQKAVNGETVWVLNPCGLSFDISAGLSGVISDVAFRLNF